MPFSKPIRQAFLSLAFFLLVSGSATAGTLFGTVTEIHDGDSITIICLKRPLEVRLMGIVAPEREQAHSDLARQHLSDLILNKQVVVNYSGLGENALIVGTVFLNDADIGAQMLRDGAAWYDKPYDTILTQEQRDIYAACELAARNEHRGIWQDPNPVSPWAFKESRRLPDPPKSRPTPAPRTVSRRPPRPDLTSESLSPSFASIGAISLGTSEAVQISKDSKWTRFTYPDAKVSMLVPGDGTKRSSKVLTADGRTINTNVYLGNYERTGYIVVTSVGQSTGESDESVLDEGMSGMVTGIKTDFQRLGKTFDCYPELEKNFSVGGYAARQYDLSGCTASGRSRIYTRVVNNVRELYISAAFFVGEEDPNVRRFFDSFAAKTPARPAKINPASPKSASTLKKI